ncbi:FAD-dependent oxidoreductase [Kineococcus sp. SYSU DK003]|uniref:FAD-dependent oxidoreductase n=1 Tax=Kineococcus sp. SYSU DK003 TaxID=3383124 RepID=UPI003D7D8E30
MTETPDVLVVGGGPAGMSAALAAVEHGATVVLLESSDDLGGQYWRHLPPERPAAHEDRLHHGLGTFRRTAAALRAHPRCEVVTEAQVWTVDGRPDGPPRVHVLVGPVDGADRVRRTFDPARLVLATGAHERTLPFPGWDLPGVYSGGAAQTLAKGERIAVGRRVLVAGAGPFLLPVAASLLRTGSHVVEVVEASSWPRLLTRWAARPWELASAAGKAGELVEYVRELARHRIPYRAGTTVVAAHGQDRVEAVTVAAVDADWRSVPGTERTVEVDALCVSHGFVGRTELATSAGCRLDAAGRVVVDDDQRTSVPGVLAAGELTGIGGVDLSLVEGRIAGAVAAGVEPSPADRRRRTAGRRFADRLEAAHGIGTGWTDWLREDTLVCRCEEVTAGEMRRCAQVTGAQGLKSLKLTSRAGLGICQGRICGRSVEEFFAAATGNPALREVPHFPKRPIAVPVRLGDIATRPTADTPE